MGSWVAHGHLQRCPCQSHDRCTHFMRSTRGSEMRLSHLLQLLMQMYLAASSDCEVFSHQDAPERMPQATLHSSLLTLVGSVSVAEDAWPADDEVPQSHAANSKTLLQSPARAYLRMQSAKLRACKGFRPRVQRMRRRPEVTLRGARTWACVLCWSAAVLRKCGARGREIGRTLGGITRLHRDTTHEYYHTAAQHLLPPERASSYGHSKYSVCQHVSGQHRPFASFIDSFVLKSYCRPLQGVQLSILPYRSFWKLILPPCPQKDTKQRFPRHPLTCGQACSCRVLRALILRDMCLAHEALRCLSQFKPKLLNFYRHSY